MAWRAQVSRQLHELKLLIGGQNPAASQHLRSFIESNYTDLKTLNPNFPFLVRSYDGPDPMFIATYGFGHTVEENLKGLDEKGITQKLQDLVALGEQHPRAWPATDDLPPVVVSATSTD